ncbi:hypothetical protein SAMN05660841_02126 [Sphingobacterium nematocida]|uniref:Uncharacterized protein n=1 Tax=Sphingobacterium nematocida TaxID=1513896 RepID=A0A1T5DSF7_9SPHI|nr:hypothetical protein SAMN05660841_02126 [Sphingobacterium nematocida]
MIWQMITNRNQWRWWRQNRGYSIVYQESTHELLVTEGKKYLRMKYPCSTGCTNTAENNYIASLLYSVWIFHPEMSEQDNGH